jgi:hypothetical protein
MELLQITGSVIYLLNQTRSNANWLQREWITGHKAPTKQHLSVICSVSRSKPCKSLAHSLGHQILAKSQVWYGHIVQSLLFHKRCINNNQTLTQEKKNMWWPGGGLDLNSKKSPRLTICKRVTD